MVVTQAGEEQYDSNVKIIPFTPKDIFALSHYYDFYFQITFKFIGKGLQQWLLSDLNLCSCWLWHEANCQHVNG